MIFVAGAALLLWLLLMKHFCFWKGKAPEKLLSSFQLIAHRGITENAPENSLSSIILTADSPCNYAEIDLCITADDVVIVRHNTEIINGSGGSFKIRKLKYNEIKEIISENGKEKNHLSTLEEVMENLPEKVNLILELKTFSVFDFSLEKKVVEIIKNYRIGQRIVISSFNPFSLLRMKILSPSTLIAFVCNKRLLLGLPINFWIRLIHPDILHPEDKVINQSIFTLANHHNLPIQVWTINDSERARELYSLGVNGIFTDTPNKIKDVVST